MPEEKSLSPAINRAVAVLETLCDQNGMTMSDLSRELDLSKSSMAYILSAMDSTGLIERSDQLYSLGRRLVEFGAHYLAEHPPVAMFQTAAKSLPTASQETVVFAELAGKDVIYLARHYGSQPIRLTNDIGRRMPAVVTALGQAMLADLPDEELEDVIGSIGQLPQLTPQSFKNVDELRDGLKETRERGYAIDDQLNTPGVICFAVSLPTPNETHPRHAVSVTMLKARHTPEIEALILTDLRALAKEIPQL